MDLVRLLDNDAANIIGFANDRATEEGRALELADVYNAILRTCKNALPEEIVEIGIPPVGRAGRSEMRLTELLETANHIAVSRIEKPIALAHLFMALFELDPEIAAFARDTVDRETLLAYIRTTRLFPPSHIPEFHYILVITGPEGTDDRNVYATLKDAQRARRFLLRIRDQSPNPPEPEPPEPGYVGVGIPEWISQAISIEIRER